MAAIASVRLHHDHVGKQDIHIRMLLEEIDHPRKSPGQVLLIAVQVSDDLRLGFAQATVDGVVHSRVLFHDDPELRMPIRLRARKFLDFGTAGILHEVFDVYPSLIGYGCDAQAKPVELSKTGCDYGNVHPASAIDHPHNPRRISNHDGVRWNVLHHDRARADAVSYTHL